jgi:hypothetical protein
MLPFAASSASSQFSSVGFTSHLAPPMVSSYVLPILQNNFVSDTQTLGENY